jgi:aspartyl-tRNA(Asn)/glutamyl-tRNA(Gln) amidotransferase subunit C
MSLSREKIAEIAHMARIRLSEEEVEKYSDINKILDLAEQIKNIDTEEIEPMSHPLNIKQRLRKDEVTETNKRDVLQALAPGDVEMGIYLVPKVIE